MYEADFRWVMEEDTEQINLQRAKDMRAVP